jgi:hypothetical protein
MFAISQRNKRKVCSNSTELWLQCTLMQRQAQQTKKANACSLVLRSSLAPWNFWPGSRGEEVTNKCYRRAQRIDLQLGHSVMLLRAPLDTTSCTSQISNCSGLMSCAILAVGYSGLLLGDADVTMRAAAGAAAAVPISWPAFGFWFWLQMTEHLCGLSTAGIAPSAPGTLPISR